MIMYKLTGLTTETTATKNFFSKNEMFFVKRLSNGHFKFIGNNRVSLETSTGRMVVRGEKRQTTITTRHSKIEIIPVIDDTEWFRVNPRAGYYTADVQYEKGSKASEIGAKIAFMAMIHGFSVKTFKKVSDSSTANCVIVTLRRGNIMTEDFRSIVIMITLENYKYYGKSAKIRFSPMGEDTKELSLAGSWQQTEKKIKSLLA